VRLGEDYKEDANGKGGLGEGEGATIRRSARLRNVDHTGFQSFEPTTDKPKKKKNPKKKKKNPPNTTKTTKHDNREKQIPKSFKPMEAVAFAKAEP